MTSRREELSIEEKVVVFFDICSSSTILEDMLATKNMKAYRDLLLSIKNVLRKSRGVNDFIIYKFIGDGWILLFPPDVSGSVLIKFLNALSAYFSSAFRKKISPILRTTPPIVGLTFGIDRGRLVKMTMNGHKEYIGRALNVASRLQGAIKDKDKKPAYKVLISKNAYKALAIPPHTCKVQKVTRRLRNIHKNRRIDLMKLILRVPAK